MPTLTPDATPWISSANPYLLFQEDNLGADTTEDNYTYKYHYWVPVRRNITIVLGFHVRVEINLVLVFDQYSYIVVGCLVAPRC